MGFGVLKFIFERGASSFHNPHPACAARIVCAVHLFYFVSLLRSSLVPSFLFEDKRERMHRASRTLSIEKFYLFFFPSWLKAAPRPALELQSRILLPVYAVKQSTVAAHLQRNCGSRHCRRTFQINALIAEICVEKCSSDYLKKYFFPVMHNTSCMKFLYKMKC